MWCIQCNNHLSKCICPDIDERLATLANSQNIITEFCDKCSKHRDRCKCKQPKLKKTGILKPTN